MAPLKRRRGWLAGLLGLVMAALYLERAAVLAAIGGFLVVQDAPQPSDAIVVLSGSLPDRIMEAVDLCHAGLAPRIVLTQEMPLPGLHALRARGATMVERHEQNLDIARQLGVPSSSVVVLPTTAWSTLTEAEALAAYFDQEGIRSIILVTSKAHARRAALTLRDLTGGRVRVLVAPSRYDPFEPDTWWRRRPWARRLLFEYLKLANYLLVERWRVQGSGDGA